MLSLMVSFLSVPWSQWNTSQRRCEFQTETSVVIGLLSLAQLVARAVGV
jgi:peroxiredoxin